MSSADRRFAGSIPEVYENSLVPLIFEPYAVDLARRLAGRRLARVLEVAAGTGVVTRALTSVLGAEVSIVATDLNQPMLAQAAARGTSRPVEWRQADAMNLPFDDGTFDAVLCQFGVMFFPDKARAFAEARRVLRTDGTYLFNVWDGIETNQFADAVTRALARLFPQAPPRFMARTPHGYADPAAMARDLSAGGFRPPFEIETVTLPSRAPSARTVATAFCQGTPLSAEIEACGGSLAEVTTAVEEALTQELGRGAVTGMMQAWIVTARSPG